MFCLYGFPTQNTMKALYVLEELQAEYEFLLVDLGKGEQRSESYLKLTPIGKTPVLQHNEDSLFESGAICRYVANVTESPLYPTDKLKRAKVDQWMDYFSCHLGRWLSALFYEKVVKPRFGIGETDERKCEDYRQMALNDLSTVNRWLAKNPFMVGRDLTLADFFAFAYVEQVNGLDLPLKDYPHVKAWLEKMEVKESIQRARKRLQK